MLMETSRRTATNPPRFLRMRCRARGQVAGEGSWTQLCISTASTSVRSAASRGFHARHRRGEPPLCSESSTPPLSMEPTSRDKSKSMFSTLVSSTSSSCMFSLMLSCMSWPPPANGSSPLTLEGEVMVGPLPRSPRSEPSSVSSSSVGIPAEASSTACGGPSCPCFSESAAALGSWSVSASALAWSSSGDSPPSSAAASWSSRSSASWPCAAFLQSGSSFSLRSSSARMASISWGSPACTSGGTRKAVRSRRTRRSRGMQWSRPSEAALALRIWTALTRKVRSESRKKEPLLALL
mmetsp:Transcript_90652/g.270536  ORF Transcript_90652/g.270536 Transcript_90652/m.270536 type:complete len:295 (-) Transcript_90652:47-931(-)